MVSIVESITFRPKRQAPIAREVGTIELTLHTVPDSLSLTGRKQRSGSVGALQHFGVSDRFGRLQKGQPMDTDTQTKTALEDHWRASDRGDTEAEAEHAIYRADATLDYPQSGERFRGCAAISEQRSEHPASRHFTVLRIVGNGDLWVSECVITYDGVPTYSVSIMEFVHPCVVHETQYFADAFGAPEWRTALAEPMPGRVITRA